MLMAVRKRKVGVSAGNINASMVPVLEMHIKALKLPPLIREYRFHPERRWRFDLASPKFLLAIEIDGGTWTYGRHSRGTGIANDCEKYNEALLLNWRILRVTPQMITDGRAIKWYEGMVKLLTASANQIPPPCVMLSDLSIVEARNNEMSSSMSVPEPNLKQPKPLPLQPQEYLTILAEPDRVLDRVRELLPLVLPKHQ